MTHTPGPWSFQPGDSVVYISADRQPVAHTDTKPYYQRHDEQDIANARLMASAPELLAALKDLLSDCEEYARINNLHNADGSPATHHAMRRARSVINQAEGLAHSHSQKHD